MLNRNTWVLIALMASPAFIHAQWLNYPTAGIPRTADGKPKLSALTPRAADGRPNLSGLWQTESAPPEMLERLIPGATNGAGEEPLSQYFVNILFDFKPEEAPILPAAAASFLQRAKDFSTESPLSHCLPEGMPLVEMAPAPYTSLVVDTIGLNDRAGGVPGHRHRDAPDLAISPLRLRPYGSAAGD